MFRYKNNSYCFTYYTQGNIIFHFIYTIFDKELFSKYTNSHAKECKLYNKLLNKISPETELSISGPFRKDGPALVPILYIYIYLLLKKIFLLVLLYSLSYKSLFFSPIPELKNLIVEVEGDNDIDSDIEI